MSNTQQWEDGSLGRDAEHAVLAPGSKQEADDALGLQLISIRLQKQLLTDLKRIADHHGIGYQPMIRDLLNRFAQSELKKILLAEVAAIEQAEQTASEQSSVPVREFLERRQA